MIKAIHYGQIELIPGIYCDAYILDNNNCVLSQRGLADLLGIDHMVLIRMETKGPPKNLKSFFHNNLVMETKVVKVLADNPYKGRNIQVYDSFVVSEIIRIYVLALAHRKLRANQIHIGERCAILQSSLIRTALDAAIKEACGIAPQIQETAQKHYTALELIQESGFVSSISDELAIKKDIAEFLHVPDSTLNSFLKKHKQDIKPIVLDVATIRSIGSNANRMHGYKMEDVAKIIFGMDTEVGIALKRKMFGDVGTYTKPNKDEIGWREILAKVFAGFQIHYNYRMGKYKIDFLIPEFLIALECNGYEHKYYNVLEEARREKIITRKYALIRFHHKNTDLETLFNAILKAKPGQTIMLYDPVTMS